MSAPHRSTRSNDPVLSRRRSLRSSNKKPKFIQLDVSRESKFRNLKRRRTTATSSQKDSDTASLFPPPPPSIPADEGLGLDDDDDDEDYRVAKKRRTPIQHFSRDGTLAEREHACELREQTLRFQEARFQVAEMDANLREAKDALHQLTEHFTCALCYDILAYPYALNAVNCGHTFCALCILKWFFSRLHEICGGWHECVYCPICRSPLVLTPDRPPRLGITFPFLPNRVAATVCHGLVERMKVTLEGHEKKGASNKTRAELVAEMENVLVAVKVKKCQLQEEYPRGRKGLSEASKGNAKELHRRAQGLAQKEAEWTSQLLQLENSDLDVSALDGWRQHGTLRREWLKRETEGKKEMCSLVSSWTAMDSNHFIEIKLRLGV